jgi:hypothetical protein
MLLLLKKESQIALNRYIRDKVKEKVGVDFLVAHQISEIPAEIMEDIKKDAFMRFLPNDRRPMKAWGLAMCSLRCLKRELVKNKNKLMASEASSNMLFAGISDHSSMLGMDHNPNILIKSEMTSPMET